MAKFSWGIGAGIAVVAAGAGFGAAQLTHRGAPEAAAPPPPAAAAPGGTLTIPPGHLATMQIAVEPVDAGMFGVEVRAPATVASSPGGQAVVTAQAAGAVVRLNRQLGDTVRAGEVLALVSSREASTMTADRSVAEARAAQARSRLERERRLFDQKVSPRQDLETAQADLAAAEAEVRRARTAASTARVAGDGRSVSVVAPISGRIAAQGAALGAFVQPETELFRIADPKAVQVEAAVPAADAARIRPGDTARVTTASGASLPATVRSLTPTLDLQTRAATVVLALTGGGGDLAPGEAVQALIAPRAAGPAGVVIPEEAVQSLDGKDVVFVRTAGGFKVQPVTVAARGDGRASIGSGLSPGQSVATRNAFLLKAELTKGSEDEE